MAKRGFSAAERWAIYSVHGERCYLCPRPLDLQSMQVDHIIPESLLDMPDKLAKVLKGFGLPEDFDLNSYRNWLPAHNDCNNSKRAAIFDPSPLIQLQLQKAAEKAPQVAMVAEQTISDGKLSKALVMIELAAKQEDIDFNVLQPLLDAFQKARAKRGPPIAMAQADELMDYLAPGFGLHAPTGLTFLILAVFSIGAGVATYEVFGTFKWLFHAFGGLVTVIFLAAVFLAAIFFLFHVRILRRSETGHSGGAVPKGLDPEFRFETREAARRATEIRRIRLTPFLTIEEDEALVYDRRPWNS